MAAFDADPAQERTDDGQPVDIDAYGWAAHRRDRDTWSAFQPVREHSTALLTTAATQLGRLPATSVGAWASRINTLAKATRTLEAEHKHAVERIRAHVARSHANLDTVDLIITDFFDETWSALEQWTTGGHAVIELNTLTGKNTATEAASPPPLRHSTGHVTPPPPAQGPGRHQ
ncbi:hypothetical protein [Streptomyces sp. NPDC088789]|uniref:hypothetical protein n=1 Tax=Streptomyces sp. NPDC088789 TaxID=3365899 RepID=UPI00382670A4